MRSGSVLTGETQYSRPKCLGARPRAITGNPVVKHSSISYVERSNFALTLMNCNLRALTLEFSRRSRTTFMHWRSIRLIMASVRFTRCCVAHPQWKRA